MGNDKLRPALGQSAELGSLYDARSDSFIGLSLLKDTPPAGAVTVTDDHSTKMTMSSSDSFSNKLNEMNMNASLSASFLSGMVDVGGSGHYLKSERDSNRILKTSLHYDITTKHEKLNLVSKDLNIAESTLMSGAATHVVVAITWGAKSVITAQHKLSSRENRSEIEGKFHAKFEKLSSLLKIEGAADMNLVSDESENNVSFEVSVHGDVLADDDLIPTDMESAYQFIKHVPRYIKAANSGKGKQLTYTMLPLETLAYILDVEISAGIVLKQLSIECLQGFVQLFDDIREAQRNLNDYLSDLRAHKFCIPPDHIMTVQRTYNKARNIEYELKERYASLLKEVRSGYKGAEELSSLLKDFSSGDTSPGELSLVTSEYSSKMAFADVLIAKKAIYLGYGSASLETTLTHLHEDDAYAFFFDKQSELDSDSWNQNYGLLIELLEDTERQCPVILVDCDTKKLPSPKTRISHFRNSRVIVEDMLEEAKAMSDKCFVRYDESHMDTSGVLKPLKRTPVEMPCPGNYCMPNSQVHEWFCFRCLEVIEWGFDDYVYCDCGRCPAKNYKFKCKERKHGAHFQGCNTQKLIRTLNKLRPFPELNVLILGETGVGKSTFINAFINYLTFPSLDAAMDDDDLRWVIPCSFGTTTVDKNDPNEGFIKTTIRVGQHDRKERDGSKGQSATQEPTVHTIPISKTIVRLIDTPGIGDTEGVEKDRKNMASILTTLGRYKQLHGILILLKPNDSRLTVIFRFCINELLSHLHRDAARNMVFGFTNSRTSNYGPGDTFVSLEELLQKEHRGIDLTLSKHTIYCFDSESFRFLAAKKQGVEMENIDDFRRSWEKSGTEANRLIQHFKKLPPHETRSTLSLNRARQLIQRLTQPMAEMTQTIEANVRSMKDKVTALERDQYRGDELKKELEQTKTFLIAKQLDSPRTVCSDAQCVDNQDDGTGKRFLRYKRSCHQGCKLQSIKEQLVGDPQLARCSAFQERFDAKGTVIVGDPIDCKTCGHSWMVHLHVTYETQVDKRIVRDPEIEKLWNDNVSAITIQRRAVSKFKLDLKEYRHEHATIQDAAARFGLFLKKNAITPYNDAMLDYIDHQIRQEKDDIIRCNTGREKLDRLIQWRKEYEERINTIKKSMSSTGSSREKVLDEEGVDRLIQELYEMKHWGKNLQEVQEVATESEEAAYREQSYAPPQQQQKKKNKFKSAAGSAFNYVTGRGEHRAPVQYQIAQASQIPRSLPTHQRVSSGYRQQPAPEARTLGNVQGQAHFGPPTTANGRNGRAQGNAKENEVVTHYGARVEDKYALPKTPGSFDGW